GPDCASTFIGNNGINEWIQYGVGAAASLPCLPSSFIPFDGCYYSPGLCPSGYTSACFAQISLPTRSESETQATCCPSSYSCRIDRGTDPFCCLSCFLGSSTFSVSSFSFSLNSAGETTQISAGTTTTVRENDCIRAYGPVVHIVAGDIQSTTSSTSSSSITSSSSVASRTSSRTATAKGPTTTGDTKNTEGLSAGASAGIGIGGGLAVILVVGFIIFFFRQRRRRLRGHGITEQAKSKQGFPYHQKRQQQQQQQQQLLLLQQMGPQEISIERLYKLESRKK
ncbi:hypothetical protein GGR58DRAFT_334249, partial [Xylaria digitata]